MKPILLPLLFIAACASTPVSPPPIAPDSNGPSAGAVAPERPPSLTSADLRAAGRGGPVTASSDPDPNENKTDRVTSEHVRKALMSDPALERLELDRIRISNDGGKITLNGLVPTTADKVEIEVRVRSVQGVHAVDNQIEELH